LPISERRQIERIPLEVPAIVSMMDSNGKEKSYELITRDISSGGAFLMTENPLKEGTDVKVDIVLSLFKNRTKAREKTTRIDVSGYVTRTEDEGMAVCFNRKFKIMPV
jgi:c-di-GMP-binding flagellar brake protein YcgR